MIRPLTTNDLDRVNELYFSLFQLTAETAPNYHQPAYQDKDFLAMVSRQENGFMGYVYEVQEQDVQNLQEEQDFQSGHIAGFVIAQLQSSPPYNCFKPLKAAYLMDIVVDEKFRGQGIGTQIIRAIKEWGSHHETDYLELSVLAKNERAMQLYMNEGFEAHSISMRIRMR
ncbi:MAG: GNAT family N-acetyltransferase [Pedobacter sp.]|nr:MAG: GNAT family N-acetyltransferase [Pedobacter sp.]